MAEKSLEDMMKELALDESISLESIPNIDLYMDQVITLFEDKLKHTKRNEQDKLLTKTMINNYTKDKLLMPAVKKKYTKEHIILMILLYELKQILSISDIKDLFSTVVKADQVSVENLSLIYEIYLNFKQKVGAHFNEEITSMKKDLEMQLMSNENVNDLSENDVVKDMLFVTMLTEKANYYKRLAEKIIDTKIKD